MGAKISRFFFSSPDPLFDLFSRFPRFFVEFRWFLRVCNVENVFTTHIWSFLEIEKREKIIKIKRDRKGKKTSYKN